mmetsp:Transcript_23284/g.48832  ORF Transcript_23284/g.48832 Transcript_23284/m.48832 type:complete len:193 (-) Transcript_23284:138-716(-)
MLSVGYAEAVIAALVMAASALPLFLYLRARQQKQFEEQLAEIKRQRLLAATVEQEAAATADTTEPVNASTSKAKRRKPKPGDQNRPVLASGTRCYVYRKGEDMEAVIEKVHHDDDPPYYTVRLGDGTLVDTVRSRLESLDERADACAAALLAEEEQAARKSKGKGGSKPGSGHEKMSKPKAKSSSGHEKHRK